MNAYQWNDPPASPAELEALRAVFPNFPSEVLDSWILHYARARGWPPRETAGGFVEAKWAGVLSGLPLAFWQAVRWSEEFVRLERSAFSHRSWSGILSLIRGYAFGERNQYSVGISDGQARFQTLVASLGRGEAIRSPPVLFAEVDGLSIADGNHRIAAAVYYTKVQALPPLRVGCWVGYVAGPWG